MATSTASRRSTWWCSRTRCSSAWPRPLKRALGTARGLHAPGRGPVPRGALASPTARRRWRSSRTHAAAVDGFVATSAYYADFMAGYLGLSRGSRTPVPLGIYARRAPTRGRRRAQGRSPSATSPASRPRRACTCWPRPTASSAASSGSEPSRLEAAGYLGPGAPRLPGRGRGTLASGASPASSTTTAPSTARRRSPSCARSTCSPCRAPTPSRRASTCSRRMANGVPWVQPRHGAFPEILERTGGGLLFEPDDAREPGRAAPRPRPRPRARRRALGRRGRRGRARATTASPAWPSAPSRCYASVDRSAAQVQPVHA